MVVLNIAIAMQEIRCSLVKYLLHIIKCNLECKLTDSVLGIKTLWQHITYVLMYILVEVPRNKKGLGPPNKCPQERNQGF